MFISYKWLCIFSNITNWVWLWIVAVYLGESLYKFNMVFINKLYFCVVIFSHLFHFNRFRVIVCWNAKKKACFFNLVWAFIKIDRAEHRPAKNLYIHFLITVYKYFELRYWHITFFNFIFIIIINYDIIEFRFSLLNILSNH